MKINKRQYGMNSLLLVYVMLLSVILLTAVIKSFGPLMQAYYVKEGLKKLAKEHPEDLGELSKSTIRTELEKHFMINAVSANVMKDLEVERFKERSLIKINYEEKVELFANVSLVYSFNNVLDTSQPDKCCSASESK